MTDYLWSKGDPQAGPDEQVQAFLSGDDVVLDRHLFTYDIRATEAHAAGLQRLKILSPEELNSIRGSLHELQRRFDSGEYTLGPPFEDGHSAIEGWLTDELGDVGRKVHTGRSRNDQVQVALRMYMRDRLDQLQALCFDIADAFLQRAIQDEMTPMPGYTHLQRAVPSSVGLWMAAFAESFLDIGELAGATRSWLDTCPLGSAAGYGVNLPLERDQVASELGFSRVQMNPMYVQNSRGRFEFQLLACFAQATMELRRIAWDLTLYANEEFGFVRLSSRYVTGSSIMPNKCNPDTTELLRAQHGVVQGAIAELQAIVSLPSAYHRDLQATKPPLIRAVESSMRALRLLPDLIAGMELNRERMRQAIDGEMYATDVAIERATRDGVPFREAYGQPLDDEQLANRTPESSVQDRLSPGGCGNLQLDAIQQRLAALRL